MLNRTLRYFRFKKKKIFRWNFLARQSSTNKNWSGICENLVLEKIKPLNVYACCYSSVFSVTFFTVLLNENFCKGSNFSWPLWSEHCSMFLNWYSLTRFTCHSRIIGGESLRVEVSVTEGWQDIRNAYLAIFYVSVVYLVKCALNASLCWLSLCGIGLLTSFSLWAQPFQRTMLLMSMRTMWTIKAAGFPNQL